MADLQVGSEFAGCRIEAVAGRGGMGVIYRATDLSLGRPVAVKLIAAEYAANREFRERFSREARLTAAIDHPNVIPVYAAGEEDDRLYLVMRYVSGTDLHHLLATAGRLEPTRAAAIITQVAAGLDAAHAAGLVHRDVKPANVLITGEAGSEHVYLSDFGITRLEDSETHITDSGEWVGTVDYMAPEHLEAHRTDARSDVYSLGGVLYTALTGAPPFRRGSTAATILAHLKDQPPLPSLTTGVPAAFDAVVARGMAKSPADRFASAGDLAIAALAAAGTLDDLSATEKEKSVARGDAAPPSDRSPTGDGGATVVIQSQKPRDAGRQARTRVAASPRPQAATAVADQPQPPKRPNSRPSLKRPFITAIVAVSVVVAVIVIVFAGSSTQNSSPKPLSAGDVRDVASAFAAAYGSENATALESLLTTNVQRIAPRDSQRGRPAVLAAYRSQFAESKIKQYRLIDLRSVGGEAGRATASYEVTLDAKPPITGDVMLGIVRQGGEPRISLIAAEPTD